MNTRKYELLLAAVIGARATSFVFNKIVLENMGTFNLLALRCILALILLVLLFHKRLRRIDKETLFSGMLVGVLFFLVMICELTALKYAASSTVSLLENCAIILVPVMESVILRKLPSKKIVISTLMAFLGVVCLSLQQGGLSGGMLFGLLSALLYAIAIIVTGKVSKHSNDSLCIGIIQVGTMGMLSLIASFLFETPHLPSTGSQWIMILMLAIVCTGFGFTLQPLAQSHVPVEKAGLYCAISPAIASLLGIVILHENLGFIGFLGLFLILVSLIPSSNE